MKNTLITVKTIQYRITRVNKNNVTVTVQSNAVHINVMTENLKRKSYWLPSSY